ncbi:MAG: PQQ-binding-like beta-propeller repeat protein, partial [Melioribacteraceae bacterium]|nr:PQQ-binding-like beta-propeller repeat protein [Melioribacteraceae bacterium]
MKKIVLLFIILLISISCSDDIRISETKKDYSRSSWPIYRGDLNLSGKTDYELSGNLNLKWVFKTGGDIVASPVVGLGKIYIGSADSNMYALNINNGDLVWKFNSGDEIEASALLLDSNIYFGNLGGDFYSLSADDGKMNWSSKVDGDIRGSANYGFNPLLNSNVVYVGCYDSRMYAFNSSTGEKLWDYKTGNYINGAPAVIDEYLAFGGCDAKLHIVNKNDGNKIGEVITGSYIAASVAIAENYAYLGKYDNNLIKIDLNKEKIVWKFEDDENGGPFFSSPAVGNGIVIAGSRDGYLYCIDKETGEKKWSFKTLDEI